MLSWHDVSNTELGHGIGERRVNLADTSRTGLMPVLSQARLQELSISDTQVSYSRDKSDHYLTGCNHHPESRDGHKSISRSDGSPGMSVLRRARHSRAGFHKYE